MRLRSLVAIVILSGGFAATAVAADNNEPVRCEAVESIGIAHMTEDGVITLRLRSLSPNPIAESELSYAPDDPQYDEIKQHLGGIAPGESKPVPPWC